MWTTKQITNDNIKKAQLVMVLQDRTLTWYIKFYQERLGTMMAKTQQALNNEFKNPKSQVQSVTEFKEIK